MNAIAKVKSNTIFPVQRRGDTLIVTPQGDAIGFSPHQIQVELRNLEKLLNELAPANLIVDLEHTNYFGSEMIGFINRLGMKSRSGGGRTAVCNISGDMQDIFDVMNLGEIWESYDSTPAAARAIATISFAERVADSRKWFVGAAALAAIAFALFYFPWPDKKRDYYNQFMSYSAEIQEMRSLGSGKAHRAGFRKRVERELKPILKDLSEASQRGDQGAAFLLAAGKQCLLPLIEANGINRNQLESDFITFMSGAAKHIENVEPPTQLADQRTLSNPLGSFGQPAQTTLRESDVSKQ